MTIKVNAVSPSPISAASAEAEDSGSAEVSEEDSEEASLEVPEAASEDSALLSETETTELSEAVEADELLESPPEQPAIVRVAAAASRRISAFFIRGNLFMENTPFIFSPNRGDTSQLPGAGARGISSLGGKSFGLQQIPRRLLGGVNPNGFPAALRRRLLREKKALLTATVLRRIPTCFLGLQSLATDIIAP